MQSLQRLVVYNTHKTINCNAACGQILMLNLKNVKETGNNVTSMGVNHRKYSENSPKKFPTLMDFPYRIWPSAIKSVKNWITSNIIITPRIDKDFHIKTFVQGSKKAVEAISTAMSSGDMTTLKELVSHEAFTELDRNLSKFTLSEKEQLSFDIGDIYFQFPYEIGLMFDDETKRCVEITMVYHVFRGLKAVRDSMEGEFPISANPPYKDKLYVLNYRFFREYQSNGYDSGWIVNVVNHFKMEDAVDSSELFNKK